MTEQRKIIIKVLEESTDHPDVESVFERAFKIDKKISIATVYRTIRIFEEHKLLEKHEFKKLQSFQFFNACFFLFDNNAIAMSSIFFHNNAFAPHK